MEVRDYVRLFAEETNGTQFSSKNLKSKLMKLSDSMYGLVKAMPDKGNSCDDSQKVCLLNAINELDSLISGIEDSDLN